MKKRLFLDMDGTLARFHDVDKTFIEAMWQQGFYYNLQPFENMVEGVKIFMKEHPEIDVYILSAVLDTDPPFVVDEKNAWLDKYLPEVPAERRIFTRAGENKADYIGGINSCDYLIDDYNKNLVEFEAAGATAIKFKNDVNDQGLGAYGGEAGPLWHGQRISYDCTPESISYDLSLSVHLGGRVYSDHGFESLSNKIARASTLAESKNFSETIERKGSNKDTYHK